MVMLALPPIDDTLSEPQVLAGVTTGQRKVEPVGETYEIYLCKKLGLIEDSDSDVEEGKAEEDTDEGINKDKMNEKRKKAHKDDIMKKLIFKNHYHALGLEHLQFSATIEDIRKAYKIKVLSHHPDKFEEGAYDETAKQQWLSVAEKLTRSKMLTKLW